MKFSVNQENVPEGYELLLFDALNGDSTFFVQWKEVELCWKWVQPILDDFYQNTLPLHVYPSGTMGPRASEHIIDGKSTMVIGERIVKVLAWYDNV